jgi:hypothetical protein
MDVKKLNEAVVVARTLQWRSRLVTTGAQTQSWQGTPCVVQGPVQNSLLERLSNYDL